MRVLTIIVVVFLFISPQVWANNGQANSKQKWGKNFTSNTIVSKEILLKKYLRLKNLFTVVGNMNKFPKLTQNGDFSNCKLESKDYGKFEIEYPHNFNKQKAFSKITFGKLALTIWKGVAKMHKSLGPAQLKNQYGYKKNAKKRKLLSIKTKNPNTVLGTTTYDVIENTEIMVFELEKVIGV